MRRVGLLLSLATTMATADVAPDRLALLAEQQQPSELGRMMLTRVRDAQLAPVHEVPDHTGIGTAALALREHKVDCLVVTGDPAGPGIVTRTDLLDALTTGGLDAAVERAMSALHAIRNKLKVHGVGRVRCIATEACRKASNGEEFIRRVMAEVVRQHREIAQKG